jgi:hypothetical protein
VPQLLKEFLQDNTIILCGAAIHNDVHMLRYYGIEIPSVFGLQQIISNPTNNPIPSLYDLSNATIGINLEKKKDNKKNKKKDNEEEDLIFGWGNIPLSYEQVKYAALDARLSSSLGPLALAAWVQDLFVYYILCNI